MTQGEGSAVDQFRNHWPTQPRFPRFAWCISFAHQPALHQLVLSYQRALQELNCLDLVPMDVLQLTLLEVGASADVADGQLEAITAAARRRLADLGPMELTFGAAALVPDGVVLGGGPAGAIAAAHAALGDALGDAGLPVDAAPGTESPQLPIAYANEETTTAFAKATLTFIEASTAAVTVEHLDLVCFDGRYRSADWSLRERVTLR